MTAHRCRETAGILFKHRCDAPAQYGCSRCQKPVCSTHVRNVSNQPVCVSCLRSDVADPYRRQSFGHLRDDPFFFWYWRDDGVPGDPYAADDFALFDLKGKDLGGDVDDDWAGS